MRAISFGLWNHGDEGNREGPALEYGQLNEVSLREVISYKVQEGLVNNHQMSIATKVRHPSFPKVRVKQCRLNQNPCPVGRILRLQSRQGAGGTKSERSYLKG